MLHLIKKYYIVLIIILIINLTIAPVCIIRTDKEVTLTGDIQPVTSVIDVEADYVQKGSINTIFVINFAHSTIFQNFLLNSSTINTTSNIGSTVSHFTAAENALRGKIQHNSSIEFSIITAYQAAHQQDESIAAKYVLEGAIINYYKADCVDYQIGDIIFEVEGKQASVDEDAYIDAFNNRKIGDEFKILRDNKIVELVFTENNLNAFGIYRKYTIDEDKCVPKIKIKNTNVGGPSGGLLQTLAIYNALVSTDITKGLVISGTGTINIAGNVGAIGGIRQKIFTAYNNKVDVFFCPEANYEEAKVAYDELKNKERMALVCVATFQDAIKYLEK